MRTFYDILGVTPASTPADVRRAYRRAAMQWHPDRHTRHVDEATRRFNEIGNAYRVLSSATRRAQYDETLKPAGERAREPGRDHADVHERRHTDASERPIVSAYAWRALDAVDREVDALLLQWARAWAWVKRKPRPVLSRRTIGSAVIGFAILCLIAVLPDQRRATAYTRGVAALEGGPDAPARAPKRRGDVVSDVFPAYDPTSGLAPFTMRKLPPSPVYDELRPLEGHTMVARLVMREDLGAAYRMYYFGISPASAEDTCALCNAYFARFMTRRLANGETVVVPMQFVFMPERAARQTPDP